MAWIALNVDRKAPQVVVEHYLDEVLNGRSVAAIDELISDRTLKQWVVAFRSAFPDVAVEARQILAENSLVAAGVCSREPSWRRCSRRVAAALAAVDGPDRNHVSERDDHWAAVDRHTEAAGFRLAQRPAPALAARRLYRDERVAGSVGLVLGHQPVAVSNGKRRRRLT